jgi:hypothetical protein
MLAPLPHTPSLDAALVRLAEADRADVLRRFAVWCARTAAPEARTAHVLALAEIAADGALDAEALAVARAATPDAGARACLAERADEAAREAARYALARQHRPEAAFEAEALAVLHDLHTLAA